MQCLQGLLYVCEKELWHLQRNCRGLEKLDEYCEDGKIFELSPSSTRNSSDNPTYSASGSVSKGVKESPDTREFGSPLRP